MADDQRDYRLKRFEGLKRRAAESLNLPVDHERVVAQAAIWLNYETQIQRLIDSGTVEQTPFIRSSELVMETAPPPPIQKVEIEIVDRVSSRLKPPDAPTGEAPDGSTPPSTVVPSSAAHMAHLREAAAPVTTDDKQDKLPAAKTKAEPKPQTEGVHRQIDMKKGANGAWSGSASDAFHPAQNLAAGREGWLKRNSWGNYAAGSHSMLGGDPPLRTILKPAWSYFAGSTAWRTENWLTFSNRLTTLLLIRRASWPSIVASWSLSWSIHALACTSARRRLRHAYAASAFARVRAG